MVTTEQLLRKCTHRARMNHAMLQACMHALVRTQYAYALQILIMTCLIHVHVVMVFINSVSCSGIHVLPSVAGILPWLQHALRLHHTSYKVAGNGYIFPLRTPRISMKIVTIQSCSASLKRLTVMFHWRTVPETSRTKSVPTPA